MNDTQAQARPKRPALEEVEAYVREKGYDDRGSANAFYGNFFYAYHDARAWRRADGTPVLDWRAEADAWHEMGPHYLEPEHPAPAAAPVRTPVPAAPVPEAPAATAAPLPVGGALPPLELADVAALAATDPAFHEAVVRKTGIPPRFARRIAEGAAAMACRIAYDYAGSRLDPRFGNWAYRPVPKGRPKHGVRFVVSADLMTELRSTFDKGGDSEADVIRRYVNVPVLIIDDLGKDSSTQWVLAKLFQIVNGRYEAERATIVTSQYTQAGLAAVLSEYGRKEDALAIVSRLAEMTERVKMDGPDRRMAPCDAEGAGR